MYGTIGQRLPIAYHSMLKAPRTCEMLLALKHQTFMAMAPLYHGVGCVVICRMALGRYAFPIPVYWEQISPLATVEACHVTRVVVFSEKLCKNSYCRITASDKDSV